MSLSFYDDCESLVKCYGEKLDAEWATYIDPFGCDLQIFHHKRRLSDDQYGAEIFVYFGGRMVYRKVPDQQGGIEPEHWISLVEKLDRYEDHDFYEGKHYITNTLIELCKRESARNREIMDKYYRLCLSLLEKGEKHVIDSVKKFNETIDGHNIEIWLISSPTYDKIYLHYDDSPYPSFRFDYNSSSVGDQHDEKGQYFPGAWEKILEKLV